MMISGLAQGLAKSTAAADVPPRQLLVRTCPVCQSPWAKTLGSLVYALFDDTELSGKYDVVSCEGCGLVTGNTPSTSAAYERYYRQYEYSPAYLQRSMSVDEGRYLDEIVDTLASQIPSGRLATFDQPLFDIGCGCGALLKAFQRRGYSALRGIDLSTACVSTLQAEGFPAATGSASCIPWSTLTPGVVTLNHVAEHLVEVSESLTTLRRRLAHGGYLYIEVPDTIRFESFAGDAPLRHFYPQHLIHFDQRHLDRLLAIHGFQKHCGGLRTRREKELSLPSLWAIYETGRPAPPPNEPDFALADRVAGWFSLNNWDPENIFEILAASRSRVFIWGIGIHVQMLLGMSPLANCNIVSMVDANRDLHGRTISGYEIRSPEILSSAGKEDTVVIGSHIHRQQMSRLLREKTGFQGTIVTV